MYKNPPEAFTQRLILLLLHFCTKCRVWEPLKSYVPMQALKYNPLWKIKCLLSLNRLLTSIGFFFFSFFFSYLLSRRDWIHTDPKCVGKQNRTVVIKMFRIWSEIPKFPKSEFSAHSWTNRVLKVWYGANCKIKACTGQIINFIKYSTLWLPINNHVCFR